MAHSMMVVGPVTDDLGVAVGLRIAADDAEPAVTDLVAVAVGAVQDVSGPPVAQAGNGGQLVAQAGGDQKTPRLDAVPVGVHHPEAVAPVADQLAGRARNDLASVLGDLVASNGEELRGWHAVA